MPEKRCDELQVGQLLPVPASSNWARGAIGRRDLERAFGGAAACCVAAAACVESSETVAGILTPGQARVRDRPAAWPGRRSRSSPRSWHSIWGKSRASSKDAAAAFGSAWLKLQLSPKSQPRKDRGPPEQAPLRQLPLPAELRRRSNNQVGPSVNPTCLVQVSHARPLNRRCVLPQAWGALGVRGSKSGAAAACTLTEGHLICHRKHRSGH